MERMSNRDLYDKFRLSTLEILCQVTIQVDICQIVDDIVELSL